MVRIVGDYLPDEDLEMAEGRIQAARSERPIPWAVSMNIVINRGGWRRREILRLAAAGVIGVALPGGRLLSFQKPGAKPLRGIFPIAHTPFTDADRMDTPLLVKELEFIDRGGVHGFVWPQMASETLSLTEAERMEGCEALAAAGRRLRPAVVLGIQGPDVAAMQRYARQAERVGADAVISLPPSENASEKEMFDYYRAVGRATSLPIFVQAVGDISVDLLVAMSEAVPNLRYAKDEAGNPLNRVSELRRRTGDRLKIFSGAHGRTLIEEMRRGFSGSMPAACIADLYAATWDLWQEGKHAEAIQAHGRELALLADMFLYGIEGMKYVLCLRGVFRNTTVRRAPAGKGFEGAARIVSGDSAPLDEAARKALAETVNALKPWFRA
jgi:4-hydroxy-tetrahydrodipicolinate synthase